MDLLYAVWTRFNYESAQNLKSKDIHNSFAHILYIYQSYIVKNSYIYNMPVIARAKGAKVSSIKTRTILER